jgi:hypothetical protein
LALLMSGVLDSFSIGSTHLKNVVGGITTLARESLKLIEDSFDCEEDSTARRR